MSKRNIAYVKPQEPAFLTRLKNQIGYKEGPTVETKKQELESFSDSDDDFVDLETEKPVVVVLKEGDLTAEEAAREEARIIRETAEAPADLDQRIIFKKRKKDSNSKETLNITSSSIAKKPKQSIASSTSSTLNSSSSSSSITTEKVKFSSKKQKNINNKLSFTNEDECDEEEQ